MFERKYKYTITLYSNNGNVEMAETLATPEMMAKLEIDLMLAMQPGESVEIYPSPLGTIDDLRNLLDRRERLQL